MKYLPRHLADHAIVWYQRRLSPRKGWGCAHLVAHGGLSCSAAVRAIIAEHGLVRGTVPTLRRFAACAQAATLLPSSQVRGVCCCGPIPIPFRF